MKNKIFIPAILICLTAVFAFNQLTETKTHRLTITLPTALTEMVGLTVKDVTGKSIP